jgi:hypothetical protein
VSFYRSDGGRFATPVTTEVVLVTDTWRSIAAADADGDGKLDVISGYGWLPGDGAGHFGTQVSWPDPGFDPDAGQVIVGGFAVADFDGDGLADVVRGVQQSQGDAFPVFLALSMGTAKGAFATPKAIDVPDLPSSITPVRIDEDSILDLLVTGGSSTRTLLGDGHGGFTLADTIDLGMGSVVASAGDFNGDGKLDLVEAVNGKLYLWLGNGSGGFASPVTTPLASSPWFLAYDSFVVGDLDGDGKSDLAGSLTTPEYRTFAPGLLLSQGDAFAPFQMLRNTGTAINPSWDSTKWQVQTGDVNGDGRADLVWLSYDARNQWSIEAYLMGVRR